MTARLLGVLSFALLTWFPLRSAHAFEQVVVFDPAAGELPESVALDRAGNVYLSMSNTIRKLATDGELSEFGRLPIAAFALGVKVGADGCVYTVSTSLDPAVVGAFVWRICSAGMVEQLAALDPRGGPNDLAFDDSGNLYVTDPFLGQIWKIDPEGTASVWLAAPLLRGNVQNPVLVFHEQGVNGIAFDKHKRNLYVSNLDAGRILCIPIRSDGVPGRIAIFVSDPRLLGADGMAFDARGNLFVAVNAQDRLVMIDSRGRVIVLAERGLFDGPSSVAFGTRKAKRMLYVTSSAFSRAFGFQPGTPHPALLRTRVLHEGLRLP
jgi:sugar lactone lactonase YvrE